MAVIGRGSSLLTIVETSFVEGRFDEILVIAMNRDIVRIVKVLTAAEEVVVVERKE